MKRWGVALAVAMLAALIFSGEAQAGNDRHVGYLAHTRAAGLSVDLYGSQGGKTLGLAVSRRGAWSSEQSYYISRTGSADDGRLHGRIGTRGHAELQFRQRGRREVQRFGCNKFVTIPGRFVGNFRFRGEARYVDVDERRMSGEKTVITSRPCGINPRERREPGRAALTACDGRNGLIYQASRQAGRTWLVAFGPVVREQGYQRASAAFRGMRPGRFTVADDFTTARLTPPPPFRGVGAYESGEISGNLRWRTLSGQRIPLTDVSDASLAATDRRACAGFLVVPRAERTAAGAQRRLAAPGVLAPGRAYAPAPAGSAAG